MTLVAAWQSRSILARPRSPILTKEETSEEGCSSVKSDLEVDQEASSLEPEHEVLCSTKRKEIEVCEEVVREDLQGYDSENTPRQ